MLFDCFVYWFLDVWLIVMLIDVYVDLIVEDIDVVFLMDGMLVFGVYVLYMLVVYEIVCVVVLGYVVVYGGVVVLGDWLEFVVVWLELFVVDDDLVVVI